MINQLQVTFYKIKTNISDIEILSFKKKEEKKKDMTNTVLWCGRKLKKTGPIESISGKMRISLFMFKTWCFFLLVYDIN